MKTNIIVFTFKGQLDAFSEKQFKTFVTTNLENQLPFVINLTNIDFLDSSGLGALVQTGRPHALTSKGLTQSAGFEGVDGIFRFLKDRTNERGLAIAEVRDKQVYIIDPAPRFFRF